MTEIAFGQEELEVQATEQAEKLEEAGQEVTTNCLCCLYLW